MYTYQLTSINGGIQYKMSSCYVIAINININIVVYMKVVMVI